jgi:hypothetical protein
MSTPGLYKNPVGCFWDYGTSRYHVPAVQQCASLQPLSLQTELTPSPENLPAKRFGNFAVGYVAAFQEIARKQGTVTVFKAYLQVDHVLSKKARNDYQSMGVTLVDCPHAGKKEVADKMMIGSLYSPTRPMGFLGSG